MVKRRPQGLYGQDLIDWIYEHRTKEDPETGCRIWTGVIGTAGSPMVAYGKRGKKTGSFKATRLFWELSRDKKIPEGMVVGHTCETISSNHHLCVNVDHLKLQTPSENMHTKYESHRERGIVEKLYSRNKGPVMPC